MAYPNPVQSPLAGRVLSVVAAGLLFLPACASSAGGFPEDNPMALPQVGDHRLRVLTPQILELTRITTKPPDGPPQHWNFTTEDSRLRLPPLDRFRVTADGKPLTIRAAGFKRRVLYAPLKKRDLRIANQLYLTLDQPLPESAAVKVENPDRSLWGPELAFAAKNDPYRWSPALHVNQVGYVPGFPKKAMIGFYMGSLGEMPLAEAGRFHLIDARTKKTVYSGTLVPRKDRGYTYPVQPYQKVYEADFSAFRKPGEYRLQVPGLGVSFPFDIHEGVAAAFARTYALGVYHQRCGAANALPFTRFVHAPCHTAPASIPTSAFKRVGQVLSGESSNFKNNPRHTAPQLKDLDSSLYPFVHSGSRDVSGGHHDAGDYSKYTINSAQLIHHLVFAADALPGVGELDNLGVPESGDGKSDFLQIARREAEFLSKMQDGDGGFFFLVYPRDRSYEDDVLPDRGDPQVVFPKTTAATAAAVAALAQIASSPRFKKQFPKEARRYLSAARKGWAFLKAAMERHGEDGSYQKITHYGDTFMHDDEITWAATEMALATGDPEIHSRLLRRFDPSDPKTRRWTWVRLFEGYGGAIRSYAFATKTGRTDEDKLDPAHLKKCLEEIRAGGKDALEAHDSSAYGTSFPSVTKRFRTAGWYFSLDPAFDMAVAAQIDQNPRYLEAILGNVNYEGGTNPNNVTLVTGLGWRRQREIVHQYALNDRRTLPPSGIPIGNIQEGFMFLEPYQRELGRLSFPPDGDAENPYPFYDRWGDSFNVATEFVIVNQARGLAALGWLMAQTSLKDQAWRSMPARITGVPKRVKEGQSLSVRLTAPGIDLSSARIVWEARGEEPAFGQRRTITAAPPGQGWIEAEARLPDGRRLFAVQDY